MTMMKDIGIGSAIAYMTMMMDVEGAIAIFTTMRVIEMTIVMDMTTMIALVFTTKEAGMSGLVCHRNRHKLVTGRRQRTMVITPYLGIRDNMESRRNERGEGRTSARKIRRRTMTIFMRRTRTIFIERGEGGEGTVTCRAGEGQRREEAVYRTKEVVGHAREGSPYNS